MDKCLVRTRLGFHSLQAGGVQTWSNRWSNRATLLVFNPPSVRTIESDRASLIVAILLVFELRPTMSSTEQLCDSFGVLPFDCADLKSSNYFTEASCSNAVHPPYQPVCSRSKNEFLDELVRKSSERKCNRSILLLNNLILVKVPCSDVHQPEL
jgi:hypothetical protein